MGGVEPATIADTRSYVPHGRSLSNGQVLMRDHTFAVARTVLRVIVHGSCMDLARRAWRADRSASRSATPAERGMGAGPRTPADRAGCAASPRLSAPSPASCSGCTAGP